MLRSDCADTSAHVMLITAITQSASVCKPVCVCVGERGKEHDTSCHLYEQPPHYCCKGLSGCFVGSLSLKQTPGWITTTHRLPEKKNDMPPLFCVGQNR